MPTCMFSQHLKKRRKPLLSKPDLPSSIAEQAGVGKNWSETPRHVFNITQSRFIIEPRHGKNFFKHKYAKKAVELRSCSFDESVLTCTTIYVLSKN